MNDVRLDPQQVPARAKLLLATEFGEDAPGRPIYTRLEPDGDGDGEPAARIKVGAMLTRRLTAAEATETPSEAAYGNPLRGRPERAPSEPIGSAVLARTDAADARGWRVYRVTPTGAVMYDEWIDHDPANGELLVKRTGQGVPGKVRIPASAALLSPEGGGTSELEPIFVGRREAPIDRSALANALAEAYFQPWFDSDADSVDTQMREYRRRIAYIVTELLESREAAAEADLRELMSTCILPSISADSNIDIKIRNGALTALHRI